LGDRITDNIKAFKLAYRFDTLPKPRVQIYRDIYLRHGQMPHALMPLKTAFRLATYGDITIRVGTEEASAGNLGYRESETRRNMFC
jgi:hypothetical protein